MIKSINRQCLTRGVANLVILPRHGASRLGTSELHRPFGAISSGDPPAGG